MWVVCPIGLPALAAVTAVAVLRPSAGLERRVVRWTGLIGYLAMSFSVISSTATRELVRFVGRHFVRVHYALSMTGMVMVLLHPLGYGLQVGSFRVFVPVFGSPASFLQRGGRPALYLFIGAALFAAARKAVGPNGRLVHLLNHVAFLLVTAHAAPNGTDPWGCGYHGGGLGRACLKKDETSQAMTRRRRRAIEACTW